MCVPCALREHDPFPASTGPLGQTLEKEETVGNSSITTWEDATLVTRAHRDGENGEFE